MGSQVNLWMIKDGKIRCCLDPLCSPDNRVCDYHKVVCEICGQSIIPKRTETSVSESQFIDSYSLKWKLRDPKTGREWLEEMDEMSVSDFEVVYGNNSNIIVWCMLRLKGHAIL